VSVKKVYLCAALRARCNFLPDAFSGIRSGA